MFDAEDLDGDGYLDRDELKLLLLELGYSTQQEDLDRVMRFLDKNKCGLVL